MITIFVPESMEQLVVNAIEDGEWYSSEIAAMATADQFTCELGRVHKVYKVTIEEI